MKKTYRRYVLAVVAALLLSALCTVLSVYSTPRTYLMEAPSDLRSVMEELSVETKHCALTGDGAYTVTGEDPQLLLSGLSQDTRTLVIEFAESFAEDQTVQVYYSDDRAVFSEGRSFLARLEAGQQELVISLEGLTFQALRLDIDFDCQIADLRASAQAPDHIQVSEKIQVNWLQWLACLLAFLAEGGLIAWQWERIRDYFVDKYRLYLGQKRQFWRAVAVFFLFVALAVAVWGGLSLAGIIAPNGFSWLYFAMGGCALGGLFALWRQHGAHPERMFLLLTLCIGIVYAVLLPKATVVSLDDESHYRRALQTSYVGTTYYTEADYDMIRQRLPNSHGVREDAYNTNRINNEYELGVVEVEEAPGLLTTSLPYLPSAAAMWLVRVLGGSFTQIFVAGRLGNLLCYGVVMYFALKRLPRGKLLAAVIALFPMTIFTASNYSYDGWCVAFLALGTALFLDEYCHRERKLDWLHWAGILVCLAFGCLPKAIYFPVFLMCLFMPREKFRTGKHRKLYLVSVIAVTLLVALTFVGPFLLTGGNGARFTDTRGGSDVSASGQFQYILSHPVEYTQLLLRFLFGTYFNPDFVLPFAVSYQAYMPAIPCGVFFAGLAVLLFFFEQTRQDRSEPLRLPSPGLKIASAVSFFCACCLVATSMYVAITPVGADTIQGCQERYMMPVLLAMVLQLRPNWALNPIPKKYLNFGVLFLTSAMLFVVQLPLAANYAYVLT